MANEFESAEVGVIESTDVVASNSSDGVVDMDPAVLMNKANASADLLVQIAIEFKSVDAAVDDIVKLAMTGEELNGIVKDYLTRREEIANSLKSFAVEVAATEDLAIRMLRAEGVEA